jgi:hypothetical protein
MKRVYEEGLVRERLALGRATAPIIEAKPASRITSGPKRMEGYDPGPPAPPPIDRIAADDIPIDDGDGDEEISI